MTLDPFAFRHTLIALWEDIGRLRAAKLQRAFYVVENAKGQVFLTENPESLTIVRVCPYRGQP